MEKKKRRQISLSFSEEEFERVDKLRRDTRLSLSGLVSRILLERKVELHVRNRSMDDCMEELTLIRRLLQDGEVASPALLERIKAEILKLSALWLQ